MQLGLNIHKHCISYANSKRNLVITYSNSIVELWPPSSVKMVVSLQYLLILNEKPYLVTYTIWASTRENLSSGFPAKRDSNHSPQLQRLARKLKFCL